ncbi:MAG: ABC transporter permease [Chloroflexi bacterium]|nr:ABC transporter permease [Chloroflexota bacterium]
MTLREKFSGEIIKEKLGRLPRQVFMSEYFILFLCVFVFLALIPFIPVIASPYNMSSLSSNIWPLYAVAIGQTLVLIIAGIDLSQGAIISLTSVIGASLIATAADPIIFSKSPIWGWLLFENGGILTNNGAGIFLAVLAMLLVGLLIGFINGSLIVYARIPAFMVTLVTQTFFAGLAIYYVKSENIINLPDGFTAIGEDSGGLISYAMVITLILAISSQFILSRTMFGRWLYATGTNIRASVVSGVPTKKVVILTYMFSGFCAAVASVLYSSRMDMGRPTLGVPLLLDVIGGAVIGGSSLSGGKGKVLWTFFGVVFLTLLGNALSLLNVPFFWIEIVKGSVILLAALLDVIRTRILQQQNV